MTVRKFEGKLPGCKKKLNAIIVVATTIELMNGLLNIPLFMRKLKNN